MIGDPSRGGDEVEQLRGVGSGVGDLGAGAPRERRLADSGHAEGSGVKFSEIEFMQ